MSRHAPGTDQLPAAHPPAAVPRSVVVVGAGLAGAQTVAALRAHGFDGRVVLLGDEGIAPYDRPPLSKDLFTRPDPVWLADDIGVDVVALADEVRLADPAVDWTPGAVTTRSGAELGADAVVLACGSRPVVPPGWGADVLHTASDADRLRRDLGDGVRLVVVGAGWIGAEVAGVAAGAGADVTVVEAGPAPLARQLGTRTGSLLSGWFADAGVRLLLDSPAAEVRPDGVSLASGETLRADVVLAAVGARPATGWLRGSVGAEVFDDVGSLRVDGTGAVPGAPGLWAVGDVAARPHPVLGRVPGGHWSAALHDPDATVRAMLGVEPGVPHAPYVFSRQLGHDLALFGLPDGDPTALRGAPGEGPWAAFWTSPADGADAGHTVVRAALLVDSPRDVGAVRKAFNRPGPLVVDLDRASDPSVRLRDAVAR